MESKLYSIAIAISSILAFALIAIVGTIPSTFENVLAQEDAITPEGSVNDTLTEKIKGPSSTTTEFSAVNDTMSDQNASQWATNATLAFAQENNVEITP